MTGWSDALEPDRTSWRPLRIPATDRAAVEQLLATGSATAVYDALLVQVRELIETRHPRPAERERLDARVSAWFAGRRPESTGTWCFYPWSGRLVHVLDEPDYRELRTSRNRLKITAEEQRRLASRRIGVVGLSVGAATAVTLALEGVGGELRLADFDTLSLSNMNRLRSGVHNVGVNKAVLTAREIFEVDPYARVRVFPEGLTEENLDRFLLEGGPLDLLIEECDDLFQKVRLRERARALRMPVLMETSDRGLIDIERFDLEPERPLLHGLIGDVRAESLRALSTTDKVPFVLDILGIETLSPRFEASLYEVDRTLRTWPQLASAVALGGALNTDTARRMLLGELNVSGRFYVDLGQLIREGTEAHLPPPGEAASDETAIAQPRLSPSGGRRLSEDDIRGMVALGACAPSGGNSQPWRFEWREGVLRCALDETRLRTLLDSGGRAGKVALGAAVENIVLAASHLGWSCEVRAFPDPSSPQVVADLALRPGCDVRVPADLIDLARRRTTNRRLSPREPLARSEVAGLVAVAERAGAQLRLVTRPGDLDTLGQILGAGDRLRLLNARAHRDMMGEVRWTIGDAARTRDGLDFRTLELDPTDLAALQLSRRREPLESIRGWGLGSALTEGALKSVRAASALGLLTMREATPDAWLRGGRALQRLWLEATRLELGFQPMTSLVYLAAAAGDGDGFLPAEREELRELRRGYQRIFDSHAPVELMLFRLSRAAPPAVRSLRRPVDEILTFA